MAEITGTQCCALFQISDIGNDSTLREIENAIYDIIDDDDNHGRAAFVITMKEETNLVKNLKTLGFKKITTFQRKYMYAQTGLTMWLKKLNYRKEYDQYVKDQEEDDEGCYLANDDY